MSQLEPVAMRLEVKEGMLIENVVAQMLTASGNKLFFYSKSSEEAENRMEIDFLLQKDKVTTRHNIRPIEVKSGKNYTLSSITKCMKKFGEYMISPTVLHAADYKVVDGITYLPLSKKMFGVFRQHTLCPHLPIFRGFDDVFYMPHSRHTEVRKEDILANPELNKVTVLLCRQTGEFVDSLKHLVTVIRTLLRIKIQNLPFALGEMGLVVEYLLSGQCRCYNGAHVECFL